MTDHEPWTVERIGQALGAPALQERFRDELGAAAEDQRPAVCARWREIARTIEAGVRRGRELLAGGAEPPGGDGWLDVTEEVKAGADRIRGGAVA